jgi:hypothetical protein
MTTKKKVRKPKDFSLTVRAFNSASLRGRCVYMGFSETNAHNIRKLAAWLQKAKAWMEEGKK